MLNSSATSSVRILPTNKVYRQLFEAQVQLSDAYNQVRNNQLTQSLNITTRPESIPLVRNIKPHEAQKRQWLTSRSVNNDSNTNPIIALFHEEQKRRQNEQQQELNELKREVFNLPDDIEYLANENNENKKGNITERLASNRQVKFTELWTELLSKIAEINQNLLVELEKITRKCNTYYEQGDKDIGEELQNLIYQKEITSLKINSFEQAFAQLDQLLPERLSQIQEYCQLIQELELERIHKIRDLFKSYSQRLYSTHHLSDKDTAYQLEKQANELNTQILDNRRTYTELEARLLAGETIRAHRYQGELVDYQNKWRDATWIIHKQTWISKLSQYKSKLESTILSTCESIGSDITTQTHAFISHINSLNTFIPPTSTRDNAQKWYNQGYDIVTIIVNKRQELVQEINNIIKNELDTLKKESENIREKVLQNQVYTNEQIQTAIEKDINPLFDERKQFLQESIIERIEAAYERLTNAMYDILDRLLAFIQPAAEQWDDHQGRLEHVTVQLVDMMRECRRPHDLQNEKKLAKLDATLDEMRSASNEKALTRLLTSSYEQLDNIKTSYTQFYDQEHVIVNKYPDMIIEEVNRYKTEMLDYFHARQINNENKSESTSTSSSSSHQYYTTSLSRTTYELEGYLNNGLTFTQDINNDNESNTSPTMKSSSDNRSHLKSMSYDQSQIQTFLTEDPISTNETNFIPFNEAFRVPSNLVNNLMFNLCRAFLDYYDQWKEESIELANKVIFSKHEELNKEMDFQMHLHEPRRVRIETDIHNVRTAEIVMHEERVERHIRGVQETLEQIDADYTRMLNEFSKSLTTYQDDISSLEQVFINATTSGRLLALEDRLKRQRDTFIEHIRVSLRSFRKHFDDIMQYLKQANVKFRRSFKTFTEGGNFSKEEIEIYRKKLEKTIYQIDQAETMLFKEMEKLEKKQLDEANKIMNQFRERFKNHMTDLQFIELANRWISEAQVKIKSEVAIDNQQAQLLKTLILLFENKIDSIINPNLDKQPTTLNEVRELFHQIVLLTYERALYLKCLNNELAIPSSVIPILKEKGLITEEELVNDLHVTGVEEANLSRRPSRISAGFGSNNDEMKSVKFASSSSPTTTSSRHKRGSTTLFAPNGVQPEDINTISTIQSLLHKNEQGDPNEIGESGVPTLTGPHTRSFISDLSSQSSNTKKLKQTDKKRSASNSESSARERPTRNKTREDIYKFYCTFGEKKHPGQDFLSKILNILRDSTEGLLSHSEVFYKEKGSRPVTRPQALREKFDEFAQMMIEKLKNYEQQCRSYHEHSINDFRDLLESFECTSSLISRIELDELMIEGEKLVFKYQQDFNFILNKELNKTNYEKEKNFQLLRPTFGHPGKKNYLQTIDNQEKNRQDYIQKTIDQFRINAVEDIQTDAQITIDLLARNAERLLILFDDILTADEITRTKLPIVKHSLTELIRRQQAGRPLEDSEPTPLIERKQGHWPGLSLLDNQRRESVTSKKQSSPTSQRQKTSASIVTQKTTLPQIETIKQRDEVYQKYKKIFAQVLVDIEARCSTTMVELDQYRLFWNASIEKLQQLRTN